MKEQKFKIGDHVRFTRNVIGYPCKDCTGKVTDADSVGCEVTLDTPLKVGVFETRTWIWDYHRNLELVMPEKQPVIVITSDGKTTTAIKRLGKKVIHTATAVCSDNDTFDFNTGAELAFKRLCETEMPAPKEPEYYSGKVVCVEANKPWWTVGKIYEIKDGCITDDEEDTRDKRFHSVSELNAWAPDARRFIPLVED